MRNKAYVYQIVDGITRYEQFIVAERKLTQRELRKAVDSCFSTAMIRVPKKPGGSCICPYPDGSHNAYVVMYSADLVRQKLKKGKTK